MKKMQRLLWIFVLIFALLLAGCSQPEFGQINNGGNEGEVENGGENGGENGEDNTQKPPSPVAGAATKDLSSDAAVTSKYAVLINAQTWEILAQKNAEIKFSPASMTKVMTLLVACRYFSEEDLQKKLVHSQEIVDYVSSGDYAGTSFSLPRDDPKNEIYYIGDSFKTIDLLYGIGVASAADCTYMIVKEIAGSEAAFVEMMNQTALELGLQDTHFNNAVGFESAENYTTAKDMATIMAVAMQNELIADILKARTEDYRIKGYYEVNGEEKSYNLALKPSINSRLKYYEAFSLSGTVLEATKTGYTTQSYMVCSATDAAGVRYILVLGEADSPKSNLSGQFKDTMMDVEHIFNTYVK